MRFEVKSGKIVGSDPCYEGLGPHNILINNAKNGDWYVRTTYGQSFGGQTDLRPSKLVAMHENANYFSSPMSMTGWRMQTTDACVDSGQFGFFDYDEWYKHDNPKEKEYNDDSWYGKCCDITLSKSGYGTINEAGVVSRTLYGDGGYPVSVMYNSNKEIVGVMVDFDPEPEDEDEEDWDE